MTNRGVRSSRAAGQRASLRTKSLFLFDLDGVFYRGKESRVFLGGRRVVEAIREKGKRIFILSNGSTDSVETVHERLAESGVPVQTGEILTSALLTAEFLKQRHGKVEYFLVGEEGLETEMTRAGHRRVMGDKADFVVVGLDRHLDYQKLDQAARLVRNGAALIATHSARLYMYRDGPAMATGPIVKAIEFASGSRATVIGKPSRLMFRMALSKGGCDARDAVMVGDQADTDILGAIRAGIDAVLVTSGVDKSAGGLPLLATVSKVDDLAPLL